MKIFQQVDLFIFVLFYFGKTNFILVKLITTYAILENLFELLR